MLLFRENKGEKLVLCKAVCAFLRNLSRLTKSYPCKCVRSVNLFGLNECVCVCVYVCESVCVKGNRLHYIAFSRLFPRGICEKLSPLVY